MNCCFLLLEILFRSLIYFVVGVIRACLFSVYHLPVGTVCVLGLFIRYLLQCLFQTYRAILFTRRVDTFTKILLVPTAWFAYLFGALSFLVGQIFVMTVGLFFYDMVEMFIIREQYTWKHWYHTHIIKNTHECISICYKLYQEYLVDMTNLIEYNGDEVFRLAFGKLVIVLVLLLFVIVVQPCLWILICTLRYLPILLEYEAKLLAILFDTKHCCDDPKEGLFYFFIPVAMIFLLPLSVVGYVIVIFISFATIYKPIVKALEQSSFTYGILYVFQSAAQLERTLANEHNKSKHDCCKCFQTRLFSCWEDIAFNYVQQREAKASAVNTAASSSSAISSSTLSSASSQATESVVTIPNAPPLHDSSNYRHNANNVVSSHSVMIHLPSDEGDIHPVEVPGGPVTETIA